jgi:4-carboxymuconolactone decarboxylase
MNTTEMSPDTLARREQLILGKPPRILPLKAEEVAGAALDNTARIRQAASGNDKPVALDEVPEMVLTLLRHPDLYQRIADLSIQLQGRALIAKRDRELVVLRVTWLCQAPYVWGEHVRIAKLAGITSEEIERVILGSTAPDWNDYERALLRAAEQLHDDAMIDDATWGVLARQLTEIQLFELTVLIGEFTMVAYFQNALRLRLSKSNLGLRAR